MLATALQAGATACIDAHADLVDESGHRLVVRNSYHAEREVITAAGRCRWGRLGSTTSASARRRTTSRVLSTILPTGGP